MYRREISKELLKWADSPKRKPLLLNGARQVGKTCLLKEFGQQRYRVLHYFNLELSPLSGLIFQKSIEPSQIIKALELQEGAEIDLEKDAIFFDEIQSSPEALHSLKYFSEQMPQLAVMAAGSLLGVKLSSGSLPVGKVAQLHLSPFSFNEFLSAMGENLLSDLIKHAKRAEDFPPGSHEKLWAIWKHYLVVGGLPEVIQCYLKHRDSSLVAFREVRLKQALLINQYLNDMAKHSGQANAVQLERVFRSIPAQLARAQDDSVKRFRFTGVVPGVSQYSRLVSAFDWLEGAGLIFKIPLISSAAIPLSQSAKESFFKVYLFDIGILGALGDIPSRQLHDFDFGTYKGWLAENYVIQALRAWTRSAFYGWNEGKAEVEFVTTNDEGVLPIEVKSGRVSQAKSLGVFINKYKPKTAYILGATPPRTDRVAGTSVERLPLYCAGAEAMTAMPVTVF